MVVWKVIWALVSKRRFRGEFTVIRSVPRLTKVVRFVQLLLLKVRQNNGAPTVHWLAIRISDERGRKRLASIAMTEDCDSKLPKLVFTCHSLRAFACGGHSGGN